MRFIYLLVFCFALLVSTGCRPAAEPISISEQPISRNRMPRTNLPMPPTKPVEQMGWELYETKKEQKLSDLKGKVVLLDFWATYCPPCIKAIPHLKELQAKYGERGFQVIGLHVGGDEDKPRVPTFVERLSIDYPLAYPEDQLTNALLGNDNRIPQTLIFDREGKLVKQFVSYDENVKKEIGAAIEAQFTQNQ